MSDDDRTRLITRKTSLSFGDADNTVLMGADASAAPAREEEDHTRLFRPSRGSKASAASSEQVSVPDTSEDVNDPVVGWLVIIEGPGKGNSLRLGYGMNSIGRSADERVSVDYGDGEISRKSHAQLTYDPKGRKFYLQHGEGTNLTYLGDKPVLQPTELKGGEVIGIGNTQFSFVPFCGPKFDW